MTGFPVRAPADLELPMPPFLAARRGIAVVLRGGCWGGDVFRVAEGVTMRRRTRLYPDYPGRPCLMGGRAKAIAALLSTDRVFGDPGNASQVRQDTPTRAYLTASAAVGEQRRYRCP